MTEPSVVYLESASKVYPSPAGEVYAVRDVTLEVKAGEFFSLLGSSGSGKTTTLRLIGGFDIPEYGQVFIGGENVTTLPPYRRNVHTVFQNYALFPHLRAADNIAYPLTLAKVPRTEIATRVAETLRMFRIESLGDRYPHQLSGGQQQRVALARALINRPKVLLLDEPLSALDAKVRDEVRQELRELQQQTNLTFIYVTHDQAEALALSDRIAVMHNGRVEQVGTPTEIYNCPASPFVARFIGKANFLTGVVISVEGEKGTIDVNGFPLKVAASHCSLLPGESVTAILRPERVQVNCRTDADNQIPGSTTTVTYEGPIVQFEVETAIGKLAVTQLCDSRTGDRQELLTLSWNAQDCFVLPTKPN
jgi:ABC-type Fe3+/spermidine/putrescine transport system ATPase subunit